MNITKNISRKSQICVTNTKKKPTEVCPLRYLWMQGPMTLASIEIMNKIGNA